MNLELGPRFPHIWLPILSTMTLNLLSLLSVFEIKVSNLKKRSPRRFPFRAWKGHFEDLIPDRFISPVSPVLHTEVTVSSSLHWIIPNFLYAFFVQWSIVLTSKGFLPYPSPHLHFKRPKYLFTCPNTMFLRKHLQTVTCSSICGKKTWQFSVSK